jgi:NADPH:quinone reductase-like Zn-dependent oxidoreductase
VSPLSELRLSPDFSNSSLHRKTIHAKQFPTILGTSYAGTILSVGPGVTTFQPNDIVACNRSDKTLGDPRQGVFQKYVISSVNTAAKLIPGTDLAAAAATIINLTTMYSVLSMHIKLDRPPLSPETPPNPLNRSIKLLIYGGSCSCGGFGIKYASDAGYTVITTSSPANREFVSKLGAEHVINHKNDTAVVVDDLKKHGPYDYIVDCISLPSSIAIISRLVADMPAVVYGLLPSRGLFGIEYKFFPYSWILEEGANAPMARWFYDEYVPQGLASGQIVPTKHVLAGGLDKVQEVLDEMAEEKFSGYKYVVDPQL